MLNFSFTIRGYENIVFHKISEIKILLDIHVLTTPKFDSYDLYRKELNSLLNEREFFFIQLNVERYIF